MLIGLASSAEAIGRGVGTDPQADLDSPIAKNFSALLVDIGRIVAHEFERANDPGGAGKLVTSEQPQSVAHDDGDTGAEHARPGQPTMSDHEGGKPEIRFGFTAASGEEQEIGKFAIRMAPVG
jgi:hypothetical protein